MSTHCRPRHTWMLYMAGSRYRFVLVTTRCWSGTPMVLRSLKKYSVTLLNVVGLPKSSSYQSWVFPEPALPQNGMLMVAPSIGPVRLVGPYAWVSCSWSTKEADGVAPRARFGVGRTLWSGVMSTPAFWKMSTTRSL